MGSGGFTLIELLVYMAIMGFIIVVAGRAFSDSTSMRVRSQNMLSSAEEAGRVSALLKEDISQMGAKSWTVIEGGEPVFKSTDKVKMSDNDLSSFTLEKGDPYDRLIFLKAHYGKTGVCEAVLKIEWYVEEGKLKRKCEKIDEPKCPIGDFKVAEDCPADVEMASNVTEFRFLPSKPGHTGDDAISALASSGDTLFLFPRQIFRFIKEINGAATASNSASLPIVTSAPPNDKFNKNAENGTPVPDKYLLKDGGVGNACTQIEFEAGEEYAIEFDLRSDIIRDSDPCVAGTPTCDAKDKLNNMVMFQIGHDHLSVGLRDPANGNNFNDIPDFLFYPPQDITANQIKRHFTLSVPRKVKACIGITVAIYSEDVNEGHLDFDNFKVYQKIDRVYHFDDNYTVDDDFKYTVKAFKLEFGVKKGGGAGEISRAVTVIPVPSNGVAAGGA